MTTTILLIRHGQTAWNRNPRFRGQMEVPLDETGLQQAQATAEYVAARWHLSAVYASPMSRALQTAQAVAAAQGLEAQPHSGFLDLNFGVLQGMDVKEAETKYPDVLRAWIETPHLVRFPQGEGLAEVRQRAAAGLRDVATRHAGETVAVVAHTVVNKAALCAVLDLGLEHFWQLGQDTCAVNVIEWDGSGYLLKLMNDTSHLWRAGQ